MDPTVVLNIMREKKRQIQDTYNSSSSPSSNKQNLSQQQSSSLNITNGTNTNPSPFQQPAPPPPLPHPNSIIQQQHQQQQRNKYANLLMSQNAAYHQTASSSSKSAYYMPIEHSSTDSTIKQASSHYLGPPSKSVSSQSLNEYQTYPHQQQQQHYAAAVAYQQQLHHQQSQQQYVPNRLTPPVMDLAGLSRSASVKSVASDSGVGSSSPLSDCSDYGGGGGGNQQSIKIKSHQNNDIILLGQQSSATRPKSGFKPPHNANNQILGNGTAPTNGLVKSQTAPFITTNGYSNGIVSNGQNQFMPPFTTTKKRKNSIYEDLPYPTNETRNGNGSLNGVSTAPMMESYPQHQGNNTQTTKIHQQQQQQHLMYQQYHKQQQNQQNQHQLHHQNYQQNHYAATAAAAEAPQHSNRHEHHHQPQSAAVPPPQPQPQHHHHQNQNQNIHLQHHHQQLQQKMSTPMVASIPCDKECCMPPKKHQLAPSTIPINHQQAYNNNVKPAVTSQQVPLEMKCDCKECCDIAATTTTNMLQKAPMLPTIEANKPTSTQPLPHQISYETKGYCDCPSCHQLCNQQQPSQPNLIKSSPNNLAKPKVTPNRFIISPNSSFSPIINNSTNTNNNNINNNNMSNNNYSSPVSGSHFYSLAPTNYYYSNNQSNKETSQKLNEPTLNLAPYAQQPPCACSDCMRTSYDMQQQHQHQHQPQKQQHQHLSESAQNAYKNAQMHHRPVTKQPFVDTSQINKSKSANSVRLSKTSSPQPLLDHHSTVTLMANEYSNTVHQITKQKNIMVPQISPVAPVDNTIKYNQKRKQQPNSGESAQKPTPQATQSTTNMNYFIQQLKEQDQTTNRPPTKKPKPALELTPNVEKATSMVCLAVNNKPIRNRKGEQSGEEDEIELGEVVSIEKLKNNSASELINFDKPSLDLVMNSQLYSHQQHQNSPSPQQNEAPVAIPRKMLPIVTTRILDWLEKSVEFTVGLIKKQEISSCEKVFGLLARAWPKMLLVYMIENCFEFYIVTDMNHSMSMSNDKPFEEVNLPRESDASLLTYTISKGYSFGLNSKEYDLLRELILYHEGKENSLFSEAYKASQTNLQEMIESSHNAVTLSKLMLFLPNIYNTKAHIIENLFCRNLKNFKNVQELLNKKFTSLMEEDGKNATITSTQKSIASPGGINNGINNISNDMNISNSSINDSSRDNNSPKSIISNSPPTNNENSFKNTTEIENTSS